MAMSNERVPYSDSWYLMYSSFPNLNWARLRSFTSGKAEVFDCDGKTHYFESREEALNRLLEDEFIAFEKLDSEDEAEYGIKLAEIEPLSNLPDEELKARMYVPIKRHNI